MSDNVLQAILWISAALVLVLYLARRSRRKKKR
jgi:hypothetical protein